jgi:HD-like signal output (HDOD) protein
MTDITPERADAALMGITIPPRPTILVELYSMLQVPEPDLRAIGAHLSKDVVLSAAVLKTVNSPWFGLRARSTSIKHAVQLLGVRNVMALVTAIVLRSSVTGLRRQLERFWDSAEKVALISTQLASDVHCISPEDAYLFGLFRDIGIPILMQRFPDYKETLATAARVGRLLPEVEDERHDTSHNIVGYLFSFSWQLPRHISVGILRHHDPTVFELADNVSQEALALIAINHVAEHIHDSKRRPNEDPLWPELRPVVLDHLGLSDHEFETRVRTLSELAG